MSLRISKDKLLQVTGGSSLGDLDSTISEGIEFDSREIRGGELFVALDGENSHGHQFVPQALSRGAALVLVEESFDHSDCTEPERLVVVEDSLQAFWQIAKWWREKHTCPIGAITGSVGKTTVKELSSAILLQKELGLYSQASFNNHVGVPYTLSKLHERHQFAVCEVGMNHPGEIEKLSPLISPVVGLITKIAPVHTHVFDTLEAVADAKCELIEGIAGDGTLIINGNDELLEAGVKRRGVGDRSVKKFGSSKDFDLTILEVVSHGLDGISARYLIDGEEFSIRSYLLGTHNGFNIGAAILFAKTINPEIGVEDIQKAMESFTPPPMRLNRYTLGTGQVVIDDSYNSNPQALGALLEIAHSCKEGGKGVGVLVGDMKELGVKSVPYHEEAGEKIAALSPNFVIGVGEFAEYLTKSSSEEGIVTFNIENPEAAAHTVEKLPYDILFVKGSRGVGLDRSVRILLEKFGEDLGHIFSREGSDDESKTKEVE